MLADRDRQLLTAYVDGELSARERRVRAAATRLASSLARTTSEAMGQVSAP